MEWLQIILYSAVVLICCINFTAWRQENERMEQTNNRLRAEAQRDRSQDWERHRG